MSVRTDRYGLMTDEEASTIIDALDATVTALQAEAAAYPPCRCGRPLACSTCDRDAGDCECGDVEDDAYADLDRVRDGADLADLDPLTRTLLGYPSGIHCHTHGCPDERVPS